MTRRTGVDLCAAPRPRSRWVILGGAVAGAAGVAAIAWFASRGPAVARVQLDCVPGQAHPFAVEYASHGELVDGTLGVGSGAVAASQMVAIDVRGRATETCLEGGSGAQVFALELGELAGEVIVVPGTRQPASELLAGTSFVELTRDGAVRSIRFADGMSPVAQNIVRDLLSHRSMKLAAGAVRAWQADEVSLDGNYTAEYRVEATSETGARLHKRRVAAPAANADRPQVRYGDASAATIAIEHAWLDQLDSTTEVEVVSGKKVVSKSRTHVVLRGGPVESRNPAPLRARLVAMRASRAAVGDLAASDADRRLDDKIQRDELGDATWDTLWPQVRDASADEPKLFLQVRALLRLHPERSKDVAAALVGIASFQDRSFMILASALAATGTPEAQAALRDAIAGTAARHDNQDVLVAELGNLERPDRATEALVRELAAHGGNDESRNVAELALGNIAQALTASEPDRADALVSEALHKAQIATALDDRIVSLHTLGNTGSPRSFEVLRAAAGDPDARIRQAAAAAMRALDVPDVEPLLLALADHDPEPAVRAEAASSLRQRSLAPATFEALAQLVRRDPSEAVRQILVGVIAAGAAQFPGAIEVLAWVAQHDPIADVRHKAQLALVQLRSANG